MFLLQALTPAGTKLCSSTANAQPMDEAGIARFVRDKHRPCRYWRHDAHDRQSLPMADAIRAVGVRW